MKHFLERHGASIENTISTFDRVIFKGHLNGFFPRGPFGRYLWQRKRAAAFGAKCRRLSARSGASPNRFAPVSIAFRQNASLIC
jgi:hypothetical protein